MLPPGLWRTFLLLLGMAFPFNPLNRYIVWFQDNSNSVSLCFRLLVYNKRSPVYPALTRHWQIIKGLNKSMIILSELKLPALPYVAPSLLVAVRISITYVMHIKLTGGLVGRWFVMLKSIQATTGLCRGSPLTLHNHFTQLYRVLDTTFSRYY